MKKKITPYIENIAESGAACLITMVQGNILLLGVSHWIIATQTGLIAGTASAAAIMLAKTENRLAIAGVLGLTTGIVDYFVHPGMIGTTAVTEAIVTGLGGAVLSYVASGILMKFRNLRN
jgi:hypothetical protein